MSLPNITAFSHDDDRAVISFLLSPDLEVFRGHFPEMPILPGVAQLDWVMRMATQCFGLGEPVARDFQVKFTEVIRPGDLLVLTLEIDRVGQRLSFEYRVGERVKSTGRIKLETV